MAKSLNALREDLERQYPGYTITQSFLCLIRNVQAVTSTNFRFDVLQTDATNGTPLANEKRLNTSDVFAASAMGLYLIKAGSTISASETDLAKASRHTFPNATVFTGSGEAANLQTLYGGAVRHAVNRIVYHDFDLDTYRFYRTGQQQAGVIGGAGGTATNADQWDDANYGMIGLDPSISFGGLSQNEISIQVPIGVSLAGTSSTNFVALVYRGFKIQGAANEFQKRNIGAQ